MSSISSFSSRATKGHQPLTLFCLKIEMVGSSCSFRIMLRVHCLAVFAPRGNLFRSNSIAPGKWWYEKHSASDLWDTFKGFYLKLYEMFGKQHISFSLINNCVFPVCVFYFNIICMDVNLCECTKKEQPLLVKIHPPWMKRKDGQVKLWLWDLTTDKCTI